MSAWTKSDLQDKLDRTEVQARSEIAKRDTDIARLKDELETEIAARDLAYRDLEKKNAEIDRLKTALDTLIKDVAAAYMKAIGPITVGPACPESQPESRIHERDYESAT
jgi:hypothetical protein